MSSPRPTAHLDKEDPPLRHSGIIEPPGLSDRLEEGSDLSLVLSDGQNLCTLFESAPIAIVLQDSDGRIICSNHAFSELVGVERAELKGQSLAPLLVTEDLPQWESHLHKINEGINRWSDFKTQLRLFRTDGRLRYCSVASKVLSDAQGKKYLLSLLLDETERREIERRLRHETYHDRMTGLPNRTLFLDRLGQALLQDVSGAVLVIGLDRMRSINDAFGHAVGDRVIVEVARRLKATVQRTDTVARIGGDEFAVLLIGTNREAAFEAIHAAARPVLYPDGRELVVTASMGIRELRGLEAPELVLGDAILALQRAKELGRNRTVFYEPFLRGRASRTAEIARNLQEAIGRREFDVEYQPIHASSDGRLVGFEALARWKRSALGVISPGEFVPVAEERGLIQLIGAYVLGESLAQLERWRRIHPLASGLSVSVNLSPVQVRDAGHMELLRDIILDSGVPPSLVKFEITESVFVDLTKEAAASLQRLREVGAQLVLDDFGTGYSSLNHLHSLPFDGLKVDPSFIARAMESTRNRNLVRSIAALARGLEMHSTAEGVERPEQRDFLADVGFDYLQGFLFGRPMVASEAENLVRNLIQFAEATATSPLSPTEAKK